MPFAVIEHDRLLRTHLFLVILDNGVGLFGNIAVELLTALIIAVNLLDDFISSRVVARHEQLHRLLTTLHAARSINKWTYFEDNIADGNFTFLYTTQSQDAAQSHAGIVVQAFDAIVCKYAVLSG